MKSLKILFAVLIAVVCSKCAVHVGMINGDAALSKNNFNTVKIVQGTAATTKILGIGGLGKDALVLEAKKDLLLNNPLKEGQALANFTVDFKNSFILIVNKQKVTVAADIVEFIAVQPVKSPEIKKIEIVTESSQIDTVRIQEVIKPEFDTLPVTKNNTQLPAVSKIKPAISYSAAAVIVTSSGEHFNVESGDYFIGTLDSKGNPENGKLFDEKGQLKHIVLPRRNR